MYDWEFERDGETIVVAVSGALTVNETQVARVLALNGAGLIYAPEPCLAPSIEAGLLRPVLREWASLGAAFHIYYSSRRQLPSGLRLLIDAVRELKPLGS